MNAYFLKAQDLEGFVGNMMKAKPVIAPVEKQTKFVFQKLETPQQLRLDYDVTVLPPKKEVFPTCQDLCKFDKNGYCGCIQPEEKVLFGVHFYDIKAMDQLDYLFQENNPDQNYLANRAAITLVGSSIQTVSKRGFWGSIGREVKPKGQDAFVTKMDGGYLMETFTQKGEELIKFGSFIRADEALVKKAHDINESMMEKCNEKMKYSTQDLKKGIRAAFNKKELWEECAKDCFSCGSCNTTCPTCYCFDVQDNWNPDQVSGVRTRYWDACLTEEFAKISSGGGHGENFRKTRGERFRHRIMRKLTYLNERLNGPACVGCGRCSAACTADIADPVNVANKIMGA